MIFVTVGNATQGFRRLLDAVDELAGEGAFGNETVFIQSGNNPDFRPSHCKYQPFLTMEDFVAKIRESDMIIGHAGAGTLLHALHAGKVPVVMPRQKKYGEHVDDHQIELVKALATEWRVIPAYEPEDLPEAITEVMEANVRREASGAREKSLEGKGWREQSPILELVGRAIEELMKKGEMKK